MSSKSNLINGNFSRYFPKHLKEMSILDLISALSTYSTRREVLEDYK